MIDYLWRGDGKRMSHERPDWLGDHQHEPVPCRSRRMTAAVGVEDGHLAAGERTSLL
jgi:hypothetical protein